MLQVHLLTVAFQKMHCTTNLSKANVPALYVDASLIRKCNVLQCVQFTVDCGNTDHVYHMYISDPSKE